jgi:hypothetical protein
MGSGAMIVTASFSSAILFFFSFMHLAAYRVFMLDLIGYPE